MDADGADQTQLTFDDALKDQVPDWSPDGSKIAYAAGDPGDILVMNADGSDQHTIVGGPTDDFGSAWSPDGDQIAFIRFDDRTVCVSSTPTGATCTPCGRSVCRPFRAGSRGAIDSPELSRAIPAKGRPMPALWPFR